MLACEGETEASAWLQHAYSTSAKVLKGIWALVWRLQAAGLCSRAHMVVDMEESDLPIVFLEDHDEGVDEFVGLQAAAYH